VRNFSVVVDVFEGEQREMREEFEGYLRRAEVWRGG
jgi:hypothetical protein